MLDDTNFPILAAFCLQLNAGFIGEYNCLFEYKSVQGEEAIIYNFFVERGDSNELN